MRYQVDGYFIYPIGVESEPVMSVWGDEVTIDNSQAVPVLPGKSVVRGWSLT